MAKRDEFTANTKRILAERAGQRCSNPDCGRNTAGPSDDGSGESTQLGNAAHITAAAEGGPRYDPTLTQEHRHSPDKGIWLCAECADRVDKGENEHQYPVELLRHWKKFHESITGTDHASRQTGKIRLRLSDSREFIVCAGTDDVSMSIEDVPLPVFSAVLNVVSIGGEFHSIVFGSPLSEEKSKTMEGLSRFFGISVGELKACIEGVPTDSSLFGYNYEIQDNSELRVKVGRSAGLFTRLICRS